MQLFKTAKCPDLAPMKTRIIASFLFNILPVFAFCQGVFDFKKAKNDSFQEIGFVTSGHDASFATTIYDQGNQFLELEGGAGTFSPTHQVNQTLSSGLTFNKGTENHFLSVGVHMTYATDRDYELKHTFDPTTYRSSPRLGYQFHKKSVVFKVHVQPINGIKARLKSVSSVAFLCLKF